MRPPSMNLLNRLVAGQGTQRADRGVALVQSTPQSSGAESSDRVFNVEAAT